MEVAVNKIERSNFAANITDIYIHTYTHTHAHTHTHTHTRTHTHTHAHAHTHITYKCIFNRKSAF